MRNREYSSWGVLYVFVCLISLNFYVNVWHQGDQDMSASESFTDHTSHRSKYVFVAQQTRDAKPDVEYRLDLNITLKTVLDAPVIVRHTTPSTTSSERVWPSVHNYDDDRIVSQMTYRPKSVADMERQGNAIPYKKILLYNGFKDWGVEAGSASFDHCPVKECTLTDRVREARKADVILFRQEPKRPWFRRPTGQRWILYLLESPYFTPNLNRFRGMFDMVASYRHDSDIVAPYEKFVRFPPARRHVNKTKNYAEGKTKKVAWFVSNCEASNSRLEYAQELGRYIQVDIYGRCGDLKCPRGKDSCNEMLNTDYKFYLAFENSNCRDYITEKFFINGLQ